MKSIHPSPYMTMAEAAVYLRFNEPRAAEKALAFLRRKGVRLLPRGRAYLVKRQSIDSLLETGKGDLDCQAETLVTEMRKKDRLQ